MPEESCVEKHLLFHIFGYNRFSEKLLHSLISVSSKTTCGGTANLHSRLWLPKNPPPSASKWKAARGRGCCSLSSRAKALASHSLTTKKKNKKKILLHFEASAAAEWSPLDVRGVQPVLKHTQKNRLSKMSICCHLLFASAAERAPGGFVLK